MAASQNLASVATGDAAGNHPPLYFIILHFWIGLFGSSEIVLRAPAAIFGVLSVLIIYWLGCTLFNRRVGLIASFLSAISFEHIYYAQQVRHYSLLLLLSLLSFWLFIQILKRNRKWHYPCYFLVNILLAYTHVFGLFIIAAQIFFLIVFWTKYRPKRFKLLGVQLATVATLPPLALLLVPVAMSMAQHGFWTSEPSLTTVYDTFLVFAGGQTLLLLTFFILAVIAPLSITRIEGKWVLRKPLESLKGISWNIRLEAINEVVLLMIWLLLPIVSAFIISRITTPIYVIRYLIGASPALYLLVAKGLTNLKVKGILYPALLIILLLSVPNLANHYHEERMQWREVAALVELKAQQNDVLVFCAHYYQCSFDHYYHGNLEEFGIDRKVEDTRQIADFVNGATSGKERVWLILSDCGPNPPIESYLTDRYRDSLILEKEFVGVEVCLFGLSTP